jgi:hypothetical protein
MSRKIGKSRTVILAFVAPVLVSVLIGGISVDSFSTVILKKSNHVSARVKIIPSSLFSSENQNREGMEKERGRDQHGEASEGKEDLDTEELDTIRVRIWKALSSSNGKELSMRQLGSIVGERRIGDLKSHLVHVEKQAKTVNNKSKEWKQRRGLNEKRKKAKIIKRREKGGMVHIKLV